MNEFAYLPADPLLVQALEAAWTLRREAWRARARRWVFTGESAPEPEEPPASLDVSGLAGLGLSDAGDLEVALLALAFRYDPETHAFLEAWQPDARPGWVPLETLEAVCFDSLAGRMGARTRLARDRPLAQSGWVEVATDPITQSPVAVRAAAGWRPTGGPAEAPPEGSVEGAAKRVPAAAGEQDAQRLAAIARSGQWPSGAVLLVSASDPLAAEDWARAFLHHAELESEWVGAADWSQRVGVPEGIEPWLADRGASNTAIVLDRCRAAVAPGAGAPGAAARLVGALGQAESPVLILASTEDALDPQIRAHVVFRVELEALKTADRRVVWTRELSSAGINLEAVDLDTTVRRYEFGLTQIRNAARAARAESGDQPLTEAILHRAASMQLDLSARSERSVRRLSLDELVVTAETRTQLGEMVAAARSRTTVLDAWGFGAKLRRGLGITGLFHGEPGTGKTLAAEIIAEELALPLMRVNVARVLDKYVGETEKNLERVFREARSSSSLLLFDEADALFSTRVSVERSQDRSANLEINLLLQLVEQFDGITVLTTNLKSGLDRAFERRMSHVIEFPFPQQGHRESIWRRLLPDRAPLADDVDFEELAACYELSGGGIKNALLRAAYRAAGGDRDLDMATLCEAAEQECAAAGKLVTSRRSGSLDPFGIG